MRLYLDGGMEDVVKKRLPGSVIKINCSTCLFFFFLLLEIKIDYVKFFAGFFFIIFSRTVVCVW